MSDVMVNCNEMVSDEAADETCNLYVKGLFMTILASYWS
jgi:hypothetical protein